MLHNCTKMYGAKTLKNTSLCLIAFLRKSCRLFDDVEIDGRAIHATDDSIVRRMPITR